jgi:hypothetical protein
MTKRIFTFTLLVCLLAFPKSVLGGDYLFPWRNDSSVWQWTSTWHGGAHNKGLALDFAPGSKTQILAAQSGRVIFICKGSYSKNLVVKSPQGQITEYWHIDKHSLSSNLSVGSPVVTGQLLGSTSGKHSFDGCGKSTGHHIHWVLPSNQQHQVQQYKLSSDTNVILSDTGGKNWVGAWFKSKNVMNLGKQVDCWAGPDVLLINREFTSPSIFTALCYGSRSITFSGSNKVAKGQKIEFRAGSRIQINPGFIASTVDSKTEDTIAVFRIAGFP